MWISFILYAIALWAIVLFLYENLKSPVQILYHKFAGNQLTLREKYGEWAAITGASDGIGKGYARELARLGLNIVLIARNREKLEAVAKEIEKEFNVETLIITFDFAKEMGNYDSLFEQMARKPIRILVNNVGIGHNPPGPLISFPAQHVWDVINVNAAAATHLSRHFAAQWLESNCRGCIVNISSGLELQAVVYGSVYGATKAYLRSLTMALRHEVRGSGITVQLVSPNFVATKINSYSSLVMRGNLFIPNADKYARWAVGTIGVVSETTGYFWHGLQNFAVKILSPRMRTYLYKTIANTLCDDIKNLKKK